MVQSQFGPSNSSSDLSIPTFSLATIDAYCAVVAVGAVAAAFAGVEVFTGAEEVFAAVPADPQPARVTPTMRAVVTCASRVLFIAARYWRGPSVAGCSRNVRGVGI